MNERVKEIQNHCAVIAENIDYGMEASPGFIDLLNKRNFLLSHISPLIEERDELRLKLESCLKSASKIGDIGENRIKELKDGIEVESPH